MSETLVIAKVTKWIAGNQPVRTRTFKGKPEEVLDSVKKAVAELPYWDMKIEWEFLAGETE